MKFGDDAVVDMGTLLNEQAARDGRVAKVREAFVRAQGRAAKEDEHRYFQQLAEIAVDTLHPLGGRSA